MHCTIMSTPLTRLLLEALPYSAIHREFIIRPLVRNLCFQITREIIIRPADIRPSIAIQPEAGIQQMQSRHSPPTQQGLIRLELQSTHFSSIHLEIITLQMDTRPS